MIYDCADYHVIEGDFGGSPPEPHRPIESNDTLASKQTLSLLLAVSEGEISALNQVYVNGTPISSFDASYEFRPGTTSQTVIKGFTDIETPIGVGVQMLTSTYITRAVSAGNVDAVRLQLRLILLSQILDNGDKVGYAVQYQIETRPVAGTGTWSLISILNKKGKASSAYSWNVRVNKPVGATGIWEFRIVRNTAADTSKKFSTMFFDNYTEIQDKTLTYPGTALVSVIFRNAEQLGGGIPSLSFDVSGMKLKVPDAAHYNPVTKIYTGTWAGAFDTTYQTTNNPAWIIYNVLTTALDFVVSSKTYHRGLGIPETQIDKFSFYELAKYCDELVPDGKGGQENRFTLNNQFYVRDNAPAFLSYLLSICNANLTNQNGLVTIISDRPTASTKLVVNANVIDGEFSYPSSHVDERYTAANVTFNDKDDKFNTRTITELASSTLVNRYGFQAIDLVLIGCNSEGQARRKAKWMLEAPTALVNFSVGLNGAYYNVGEVVEIMDKRYANVEGQGLIVSATTTTITLDRSVTFGAFTYSVMVYGSDGVTLLEKVINQSSTTTNVITMTTALASAPAANTPWIIKGQVLPRQFRISSITRNEEKYDIVGTQYDSTKYARIETGVVVTTPTGVFKNVDEFSVSPVSNITFQESFRNDGIIAENKIIVLWDWTAGAGEQFVPTFDVLWRRDNLPFQTLPSRQLKEAEILDTTPGIYEVIIYAVNIRGIRSTGVTQLYTYHTTASSSTLIAPTDLWVKNTTATTYNDTTLAVTWTYPIANDSVTDRLKDYMIEVWDSSGITKKNTYVVNYDIATRGGFFNYTLNQNITDFGTSTRSVQLKLYSRDLIGNVSTPAAKTFTNPVPAAPVFTITSGAGIAYVNITPPAELDVKGYIVYRSTTSGFTPGPGNQAYDGPDTYISLDSAQGTLYYYRVAAYDTFDKTGLNIATQQSSSTLSFNPTVWSQSGLVFTPNSPGASQVAWTAGSIFKDGTTTYSITSGFATWSTGVLYIYFNPTVSTTVLQTTTTLATAVAAGNYPLATYQGGTNLKGGDGSAFISGSQLIAGSVGASQLVTGSAIITGSAQIAGAIINTAHIIDANITNAKIADASITVGKIVDANITTAKIVDANITTAKIADASITTAKINDLAVDTLKLAGNAVIIPVFSLASAVNLSGSVAAGSSSPWRTVNSLSINMNGGTANSSVSLQVFTELTTRSHSGGGLWVSDIKIIDELSNIVYSQNVTTLTDTISFNFATSALSTINKTFTMQLKYSAVGSTGNYNDVWRNTMLAIGVKASV